VFPVILFYLSALDQQGSTNKRIKQASSKEGIFIEFYAFVGVSRHIILSLCFRPAREHQQTNKTGFI